MSEYYVTLRTDGYSQKTIRTANGMSGYGLDRVSTACLAAVLRRYQCQLDESTYCRLSEELNTRDDR